MTDIAVLVMSDISKITCCGLKPMYKEDTEDVCCNDKIVKHTVGQGCCADHGLYDNSTHMCCEGKKTVKRSECCQGQVHSPVEGRTACCGGTAYNPDTHSCCQDTVVNGTGQCCGKAVMDPHTDSCCQDIIEKNASVPQASPNHGCCGLSSMNNHAHMCCGGMAVLREHGKACCGRTTYILYSELCCGPDQDTIQPKLSKSTQCCGSDTYEPGEENCCVGRSNKPIKVPSDRTCCRTEDGNYKDYDPRNATCCGSQVHHGIPENKQMCCGGTMRTNQQLCCADNMKRYKPVPKKEYDDQCCLDHDTNEVNAYNSEKMVCIHGQLQYKEPGESCGSDFYNPRDKICCSGVLSSKAEDPDRVCCGRSTRAYSPSYQSCCHGRVKTDPEHIWGCCRGEFYHKNEHDCTEPQNLVQLMSNGEASTVPPPENKTAPGEETITCAGRQHPRWSEDGQERRCCDEKRSAAIFIPLNQTCCGSRVFELPDNIARCCRGEAYDNTTQCCVNSKVQNCTDQTTPPTPMKPQISCAGYKHDQYDEQDNERVCCPRGTNSYTPATQTCCGNRVADIPREKAGCCRKVPYSKDKRRCYRGRLLLLLPPTAPSTSTTKTSDTQPEDNVACGERCDIKFKQRLNWKFPVCSKRHVFSAKVHLKMSYVKTNMTTFILTDIDFANATTKTQRLTSNKTPPQNFLSVQVHKCQCPTFNVGSTYLFLTDSDITNGVFVYDELKDVVTRSNTAMKRMSLIKLLRRKGKCSKKYYPTI